MKKSTATALDDWLAEWQRLTSTGASPEGQTMWELAQVWGVGLNAAQIRVQELCRKGIAVYAGDRTGQNIAGRKCQTPVYRLKRGK